MEGDQDERRSQRGALVSCRGVVPLSESGESSLHFPFSDGKSAVTELSLEVSRAVRNECLLFISHSVYGNLLWLLELTETLAFSCLASSGILSLLSVLLCWGRHGNEECFGFQKRKR